MRGAEPFAADQRLDGLVLGKARHCGRVDIEIIEPAAARWRIRAEMQRLGGKARVQRVDAEDRGAAGAGGGGNFRQIGEIAHPPVVGAAQAIELASEAPAARALCRAAAADGSGQGRRPDRSRRGGCWPRSPAGGSRAAVRAAAAARLFAPAARTRRFASRRLRAGRTRQCCRSRRGAAALGSGAGPRPEPGAPARDRRVRRGRDPQSPPPRLPGRRGGQTRRSAPAGSRRKRCRFGRARRCSASRCRLARRPERARCGRSCRPRAAGSSAPRRTPPPQTRNIGSEQQLRAAIHHRRLRRHRPHSRKSRAVARPLLTAEEGFRGQPRRRARRPAGPSPRWSRGAACG